MRKRLAGLGVVLGLLSACGSSPPPVVPDTVAPGASPAGTPVEIRTYGSLRAMFEEGATRPTVSLGSLRGEQHLVGIGSLSGLRGDIAILPGEMWILQRADDGTPRASLLGEADDTAGFLATARVVDWQPLPLTEDVAFDDLPEALEELAARAGLNVEQPFPVIIEGALANLEYHVVDGRAFASGVKVSKEELMVAAGKGKQASAEGALVGFFAKRDYPEFMEPGNRLHLHVVLRTLQQGGHVKRVDLPRGVTVRLPVPAR